uniref:Uncharacterized protein n=1 Tax=Utricularia reniformis TaxID=192314 RepID=A0A1Y0B3P0_9LAMI|nr:hypothetical protein AEK19_MT1826 [Utricularia reniformis]ART31997.1 hypothetical protein AEK19_MT1826 [Utricularia reniformis]
MLSFLIGKQSSLNRFLTDWSVRSLFFLSRPDVKLLLSIFQV